MRQESLGTYGLEQWSANLLAKESNMNITTILKKLEAKSACLVNFYYTKHDSKFSSIRRLLGLLLIMFMLEKDCSHIYVEPKRERTANARAFSADRKSQEYYSKR
ncbi:hypothetical protein TNCV_3803901 [Trichonephila clavipes]|nr:hypothetical protein TNCV_3803901 [Trichonephila clavipes]